MQVADLRKETLDTATLECWQHERTATRVTVDCPGGLDRTHPPHVSVVSGESGWGISEWPMSIQL